MSSGADRTYQGGRQEWRRDVGNGWTKWSDNRGNRGYEKDLGHGQFRRGDRYGKDYGSQIRWSDGTWERKWDR
jgi:hypothetical protein